MLNSHTKHSKKYLIVIDGEEVTFRTKQLAIQTGKAALKIKGNVFLIEEYFLMWSAYKGGTYKVIDYQRFDRTILIKV